MTDPVVEAERRRTFAIISHPDAGKTTLTEKFLLYGGAVQDAGQVKARGERRRVRSDWMEMEQQRGISITSTVLQFPYRDCVVNLLDQKLWNPNPDYFSYTLSKGDGNVASSGITSRVTQSENPGLDEGDRRRGVGPTGLCRGSRTGRAS